MVTKLVRSSCCAFVLLVACGYFQTAAWADGPQCETDPASCIDNPCDDDPDGCVDPDPDPGCDYAKSSPNPDIAKALAGLRKAATRAVKRSEARRFIGTQTADGLPRYLRAPNASTQVRAPVGHTTYGSQKASSSCPAPSRSACKAIALIKYFGNQYVCASQYAYRIGISQDYEDIRRAGELLDQCLADFQTEYAAQLTFCDSLPND